MAQDIALGALRRPGGCAEATEGLGSCQGVKEGGS
jgi:hypothetical protein